MSVHWDQLRTLVWLRWRLTRNQWSRAGRLNATLTLIAFWFGVGLAALGGVAGLMIGAGPLAQAPAQALVWAWDGLLGAFLFLWLIGIVTELQRSETLDLARLMHLPVSLRDVFLLNYVASHVSLSLVVTGPAALGLCVGSVIGRSPLLALQVPVVAGFFFMITAWTYCLRGWLAALMVNERRRRAVVMGVTLSVVLLAQLPNLVSTFLVRSTADAFPPTAEGARQRAAHELEAKAKLLSTLEMGHRFVPFLWPAHSARSLAEGSVWPALAATAGLAGIGAIGLARAYRATIRFYQGADDRRQRAASRNRSEAPSSQARGRLLVERRLPFLPEEASAVALASLRSMLRAPEVKMGLAINVVVFGILGAGFIRNGAALPEKARGLVATGAVMVTFLGTMQVMFNQFGFDRDGFRALVLLPARRRHVLLGKNLSVLPLALAMFALMIGLAIAFIRPPAAALLGAGLQFVAAFLALSAIGNLASIVAPYRVAAGSLKPTKTKSSTTLLMMLMNLLFPVMMIPVFLPAGIGLLCQSFGWLPGVPVNPLLSSAVAAAAACAYRLSLEPLGALLQQREQRILEAVTQEVE